MFRNFGLSFASIVVMTLSFFIVSIVGLAFYGSVKLIEYFDSRPGLILFLRGDLSEGDVIYTKDLFEKTNLVREYNIYDIDFSVEDYKKKVPETLDDIVTDENKAETLSRLAFVYSDSQTNLEEVVETLEADTYFMQNIVDRKNVEDPGWKVYNRDQADIIRESNKLLRTSGIIITVFLFVISSILIFITIKLTINYHKRELEIMDLVGASGWFIRLPFIIDGMIYGLLGGILSVSIILLFKNFIISNSQNLVPRLAVFFSEIEWPTLSTGLMLQIFASISLIGIIVGMLSSFFAIIRYVKR